MLDNLRKKKMLAKLRTPQQILEDSYAPEIEDGKKLKKEYQKRVGASDQDMKDADFNAKYTIGYLKAKGQVSTDEPPVDLANDPTKLTQKAIYKALNDEDEERRKKALGSLYKGG